MYQYIDISMIFKERYDFRSQKQRKRGFLFLSNNIRVCKHQVSRMMTGQLGRNIEMKGIVSVSCTQLCL